MELLILFLMIATVFSSSHILLKQLRLRRLKRMTNPKRDTYERHAIADAIVDGIEQAVNDGKLQSSYRKTMVQKDW